MKLPVFKPMPCMYNFDDYTFERERNKRLGTEHDAVSTRPYQNGPMAVCDSSPRHDDYVKDSNYTVEYMDLFPELCEHHKNAFNIDGQWEVFMGKCPILSYYPHHRRWALKDKFAFYKAFRRWKRWKKTVNKKKVAMAYQEWR